jgi:signal transduction histidine kinase
MSLERKIILSFVISATIIAVFAVSSYVNFLEVRREIRYLELADTVRSKSLQLRRHEKNFFLYGDSKEINEVHTYIRDLKTILGQGRKSYNTEKLLGLENKIDEYSQRFNRIERIHRDFLKEFAWLKPLKKEYSLFFPLIESSFLERPLVNAELIEKTFSLKMNSPVIAMLRELNDEISSLRKNGEDILTLSKDLDRAARAKAERAISLSQTAALILFPLFLVFGLTALFVIIHSVVKHMKLLATAIEKTGKGDFCVLEVPEEKDEVGMLINTFNKMESDLSARDAELSRKNEELLQSRKLASIGTLASGVAHELNNPLNNVYLAAQILLREIEKLKDCPPVIKGSVKDIFSQTIRVKRIVSDLLEFAREKPPEFKKIKLSGVINDALAQLEALSEILNISFDLKLPEDVEVNADGHLIEQVFINLFSNAVDAMGGNGTLVVEIKALDGQVQIMISDTGKGIAQRDMQRIFDPFFTTKDNGTGLGLAIVYSIIEKHRGKIEVTSELDKGTTFKLILPR